ncbi:putative intracellular protein transport protein (Sat1) [Aspergillus thermomutatus]|uniref:Uncharacterized protein n=1 Tax=Aspergillus thermomutatus TaxID=41047 RepID=A0A397HMS4_ASPTH|nr:uncharacterized protein CDV56_108962 [Aspergillus thermomutatus]RHZ64461.1 hypothetical protein CDV56_108962 [Aspergillus thermomutatus]
MQSDIQVFVKWKDQTIFSGEDVECIITFKNVAETDVETNNGGQFSHQRKQSRAGNAQASNSESYFSLKAPQNSLFSPHRRSFPVAPKKSPSHRISSSLSSPLIGSHSFPPPTPRNDRNPGHEHKRSVSILSIESEGTGDKTPRSSFQFNRSRPVKGHGRSASLQVVPRRYEGYEDGFAKAGRNTVRGISSEAGTNQFSGNLRPDVDGLSRANRSGSNGQRPIQPLGSPRTPGRRPQLPPMDFKFPPAPTTDPNYRPALSPAATSIDGNTGSGSTGRSNGKESPAMPPPGHLPQLTRIISTSSLSGSHRSSGEFYSASDNSSETLQSEYTNYSANVQRPSAPRHARHFSSADTGPRLPNGQTLLMGYAQISASFTVDGSLINQAAFEEVKRKGVVGAQGNAAGMLNGGPPSISDKSRKSGGFWGAFKWNAIEESISGLLSNNELDGLRDMRGVTSSRSIPLLSTPQSLLFVDLRLAPGEEQSYSFSFTLPKGLPASHKGKAIKISYNLVIGTQRPSGTNEPQRVNRITIPFRVFSGVNSQGEVLGHNLMSPYVLLRDEARVQKIDSSPPPVPKNKSISGHVWTSAPEFLSYVDEILEHQSRKNLLQPPDLVNARRSSSYEPLAGPLSCKDAIDLAILRSNQAISTARSPNRFEIARNGRRIAVVVLNRPAHRLGETITATVNFTDVALPCYALRATLESSEKVAPSLTVRSNASIHRATRRVHASFFEITLYSTRVVFSPAVPISATPTIITTGVNHEWELRLEFVTTSSHHELGSGLSGARLLEVVFEDDRGQVMSGLENLGCESFEIAIPITVYGETVRERLPEENEGYSI